MLLLIIEPTLSKNKMRRKIRKDNSFSIKREKKVFCIEHAIKPAFGRASSFWGIVFLKLGAREQSQKTFYNLGQIYKVPFKN